MQRFGDHHVGLPIPGPGRVVPGIRPDLPPSYTARHGSARADRLCIGADGHLLWLVALWPGTWYAWKMVM
eukprot:1006545-Rhodomonas_salina.1